MFKRVEQACFHFRHGVDENLPVIVRVEAGGKSSDDGDIVAPARQFCGQCRDEMGVALSRNSEQAQYFDPVGCAQECDQQQQNSAAPHVGN